MLVGRKMFIILITLLCFVGSAYAREATRLTDAQLDKVTAGVEGIRFSPMSSFLSNNNSGIWQRKLSRLRSVQSIRSIRRCLLPGYRQHQQHHFLRLQWQRRVLLLSPSLDSTGSA